MKLTASFFWKIFEETGSISAYLAYKHFFRMKVSKREKLV